MKYGAFNVKSLKKGDIYMTILDVDDILFYGHRSMFPHIADIHNQRKKSFKM